MNSALNDILNQVNKDEHFDAIRIGLASPEKIHSWSYGEVISRRRSTTVLRNLSAMACFAPRFLAR